jgi:hypothetical protein
MKFIAMIFSLIIAMPFIGCDKITPVSDSGVQKATVKVNTQASGLTVEQENIKARLLEDNKPGSIKHLYVISAYSGQVVIYSTVKGKVTSGGKRLTPSTVAALAGQHNSQGDFIPFNQYRTSEVLQDDGAYGVSDPYIFWFDTKGNYHQHFLGGGQIVHISNQPMPIKSVIINLETVQ